MFANQRREAILALLKEQVSVSVNELANKLKVSPVTIRADLNYLSQQKMLVRTHGGAIPSNVHEATQTNQDYALRKEKNYEKKQAIAKKAIDFIQNGDCIILDASSTCYELAKVLYTTDLKITVVTNGLRSATLLKENSNMTVIIIGGVVKRNSNAVEGLLGENLLEKLSVNLAFISAYGINYEDGLLDFSLYEIELKKKMVQIAHETIALIDSSKFEQNSIASFANLQAISTLITDNNIKPEIAEIYKTATKLILA